MTSKSHTAADNNRREKRHARLRYVAWELIHFEALEAARLNPTKRIK